MKDTERADAGACAGAGASAELTARFAAEVDWTKVVDLYIPLPDGQYGPDLLERLWSPDLRTADEAQATLHFACCGDGSSVSPAAPEVLPFLVEAVRDPAVAVRVRTQILETLAVLARAGNDVRTAPAAWPAAWERAVDALHPLLADDVEGDEDVRAGVAAVLARATHRADDLIRRVLARFEDEPHLSAAEQLVLAVGELAPTRWSGVRTPSRGCGSGRPTPGRARSPTWTTTPTRGSPGWNSTGTMSGRPRSSRCAAPFDRCDAVTVTL